MSTPLVQEIVALAIVAAALTWLVRRRLARKKHPNCGCDGCPGAKKLAEDRRKAKGLRPTGSGSPR